ncbi:MAG: YtxH domain-containing protein [Elusimicrobia bacterium]|nr:YtxH domain-containing protein [Elusimicrobiota bacterium]
MSENRTGEVVSAFLLGGLIGAALGILFAPASGKETREKVGDWMDETKEKAKEKLAKLEEEIKHRKDQLLKHQN